MLRRLIITTLSIFIGFGAVATGSGIALLTRGPESSGLLQPQVLPASDAYREIPTLDVLLNHSSDSGSYILQCQKTRCDARQPWPSQAEAFDGQRWYFYDADGSLKFRDASGDDHLIVSPTDLVTPRGMLVSPRNNALAYWLDNLHEKDEDLTELWVYNSAEGGTNVVAEKLVARDIVTNPIWNTSGTALSFIANSGEGQQEDLEFIVVGTQPASVSAKFSGIDIEAFRVALERGLIDVSPSGNAVAFASSLSSGKHVLHILREGGQDNTIPINGSVAYIQWTSEGELLYGVQEGKGVKFVRYANAAHTVISQDGGTIVSALADETGASVAYLLQSALGQMELKALEVRTGLSRSQTTFANRIGTTRVIGVRIPQSTDAKDSIVNPLSDGQLIAFIDKHAEYITEKGARLTRIVITQDPNTAYIDFDTLAGESKRVLVLVRDAVHPEWVIKAQYEPIKGQWQRIGGESISEPESLRLYEWEGSAFQWILKQTLDK